MKLAVRFKRMEWYAVGISELACGMKERGRQKNFSRAYYQGELTLVGGWLVRLANERIDAARAELG